MPEFSVCNPGALFRKSLSNNIDFLNSAPGVLYGKLWYSFQCYFTKTDTDTVYIKCSVKLEKCVSGWLQKAQGKGTDDSQPPRTPKTPITPKTPANPVQAPIPQPKSPQPEWTSSLPPSELSPKPQPEQAAALKSIANEAATVASNPSFLKKKGEFKRKAPPPPAPADVPSDVNITGTATIDKKVGEKILIFEERIKKREQELTSPITSPRKNAEMSAWGKADGTVEDYDDALTGRQDDGQDLYDDTADGQDDDYDEASSSARDSNYVNALTGQQDNVYDDTAIDNVYDDMVQDENNNQDSEKYKAILRPKESTSSETDSVTSPTSSEASVPSQSRRLPRTPIDQVDEHPLQKPGKIKRVSRNKGKRATIPSGEYYQIQDGENGELNYRSRTESQDVREALGAFDTIFSSNLGKLVQLQENSTYFC